VWILEEFLQKKKIKIIENQMFQICFYLEMDAVSILTVLWITSVSSLMSHKVELFRRVRRNGMVWMRN